ncbi:MAG: hypothetical protein MUC86_03240, partial [Burkholderiaceae bacterium]|nr:hypothetical protein [Burkholderiaceae bacterium]
MQGRAGLLADRDSALVVERRERTVGAELLVGHAEVWVQVLTQQRGHLAAALLQHHGQAAARAAVRGRVGANDDLVLAVAVEVDERQAEGLGHHFARVRHLGEHRRLLCIAGAEFERLGSRLGADRAGQCRLGGEQKRGKHRNSGHVYLHIGPFDWTRRGRVPLLGSKYAAAMPAATPVWEGPGLGRSPESGRPSRWAAAGSSAAAPATRRHNAAHDFRKRGPRGYSPIGAASLASAKFREAPFGGRSMDAVKAVEALQQAVWSPTAWPDALEGLALAFDCTMVTLVNATRGEVSCSREATEIIDSYLHRRTIPDSRDGRVDPQLDEGFRTDYDDFTPAEIARDPYYQDFLRAVGVGWHAAARLPGLDGDNVVISFKRAPQRGLFERVDVARLNALLPQFRSAARQAAVIARSRFDG